MGSDEWDAVVIGSGGSGLISANLMSRAGLKVLVLERHYVAGGCLHTWESSGYEWDTGVHYVGESQHQDSTRSTGRVLKFLTDGELKWEEMDKVFDCVKLRRDGENETESFPIEKRSVNDKSKTWDNFEAMLLEKFPEEKEAISKFIEEMFNYKKAGMAIALYKLLPTWLLKIIMTLGLHNRYLSNYQLTTTTREFLDSITQNEKLKCVLSYCYGDYGTVPAESPLFMNMALFGWVIFSIFVANKIFSTFMNGGYFPTGGSSEMSRTLAEPIWARGGKVLVRSDVQEICISNGRATGVIVRPTFVGSDLTPVVVRAKHVISTTSAWVTNKLIKQPSLHTDLSHLRHGPAVLYVFIGFKEGAPEFPKRKIYNLICSSFIEV